jgi:hypothetical protein
VSIRPPIGTSNIRVDEYDAKSPTAGAAMHTKQLSAEDVQILNEHIRSRDERFADLARRRLTEFVNRPECFVDSTAQEWARRIFNRVNRANHS